MTPWSTLGGPGKVLTEHRDFPWIQILPTKLARVVRKIPKVDLAQNFRVGSKGVSLEKWTLNSDV